jgi:FAD synthase
MKTLTFGRFNIPHPGHKHIIDKADIVVISSTAKVSAEKRISMLEKLNVARSKIRLGNPYKEIDKVVIENDGDVKIFYTPENVSLANAFKMKYNKVNIQVVERVGNLSSTLVRQCIDSKDDDGLLKIYGNDTELVNLAKESHLQEENI